MRSGMRSSSSGSSSYSSGYILRQHYKKYYMHLVDITMKTECGRWERKKKKHENTERNNTNDAVQIIRLANYPLKVCKINIKKKKS
jgi:hypothetical protein